MADVPDVSTLLRQLSDAFHKKTETKDASTQVEILISGWERPVKRKWHDWYSDAEMSDIESLPTQEVAKLEHECSKCHCRATDEDEIIDMFGVKVRGNQGNKKWQAWCIKCRSGYHRVPKGLPTPPDSPLSYDNDEGSDNDDAKSVIIGRRGGIYTGTNKYHFDNATQKTKPAGFEFYYTVRKPAETWNNAEERLRKEDAPIVKKRSKCIRMLATQDGLSIDQAIMKYHSNTTTELFYLVKKSSPELISSRTIEASDTQ